MNNIENIPAEVFDWMNTYSYQELSAPRQEIINQFLSPKEYDAMHNATVLIHENGHKQAKGHDLIKDELLLRFNRKYNSNLGIKSGLLLWKVAAIILAIALPVSAYFLIKSNKRMLARQLNNYTDTVYLEKVAASNPLCVYDTIYIYDKQTHKRYPKKDQMNKHPVDEVGVMMNHDLTVQPIDRVNDKSNQQKRNSIKDDSLISHFNFATM